MQCMQFKAAFQREGMQYRCGGCVRRVLDEGANTLDDTLAINLLNNAIQMQKRAIALEAALHPLGLVLDNAIQIHAVDEIYQQYVLTGREGGLTLEQATNFIFETFSRHNALAYSEEAQWNTCHCGRRLKSSIGLADHKRAMCH